MSFEQFEFRTILKSEAEQAVTIEHICFPPNEACSRQAMLTRIENASEQFLVAVDKTTGKLAGFINGLSTYEDKFRDEFFTDISLYDPKGENVMILGLDVLPEYRNRGLAREIVRNFSIMEKEKGRKTLILTCLDEKVKMYEKLGFSDKGRADSTWGGEEGHEMTYSL